VIPFIARVTANHELLFVVRLATNAVQFLVAVIIVFFVFTFFFKLWHTLDRCSVKEVTYFSGFMSLDLKVIVFIIGGALFARTIKIQGCSLAFQVVQTGLSD
jgi:hypothetical protein